MGKGTIAKQNVINKLALTFGNDFIGEVNKKIYVWADDGGSKVQIAIALTCPKTNIEASTPVGGDLDFDNMEISSTPTPIAFEKAKITQEEQDRIQDMMKRLGL